ncbi:MAG: CopG family transcriptional regulator [Bacillota bacterium]|nr:CopG family transcriptional regulator [Bacillota bacterium]
MNIRTQIYLPEELHRRLRDRAVESGKSMAEQIREALQRYLDETEAVIPKPDDPVWGLAGRVEGRDRDLSTGHDSYLYGKVGRKS